MFKQLFFATFVYFACASHAQDQQGDVVDQAIASAFQRDQGKLLCLGGKASLRDLRGILEPNIVGLNPKDQNLFGTFAKAVYATFPCPFSPSRPEVRPATKTEMPGAWLVPTASGKLRYGPKSPAWSQPPGVPPIKCEAVSMKDTGAYYVTQLRAPVQGDASCPTKVFETNPPVSSWRILSGNRIRISRTDKPEHYEEWELFLVEQSFNQFGITFGQGDLLAYMRAEAGNDIGATTVFRHLQRSN